MNAVKDIMTEELWRNWRILNKQSRKRRFRLMRLGKYRNYQLFLL